MDRYGNRERSIIIGCAAAMAARLAVAVTTPANTCIVSGSLERNPPLDASVAFAGALDSTWRAVADAAVQTKFHTQKPVGLQMVIR